MRKTKIICTMGPATDSDEVLEKLMQGGMNVARFNFSHGSHEEQKERMDRLKAMREKCGKPVAMLLDTKGPEIRTGIFEEGKVTLARAAVCVDRTRNPRKCFDGVYYVSAVISG